jgi:signal peptidase I
MAKSTKKPSRPRDVPLKVPGKTPAAAAPARNHAVRETVESIVIAFVLAFLFRTFEAEAFVIPTGSMAPTLMGRHKDVDCPKCGYRYQVSASEENPDQPHRARDTVAGMCPVCRYVLPMRPDLPPHMPETRLPGIDFQPSYNGDRILVNKYIYTLSEPQRWDVVVFKFPGNAKINYIKRLVGLPGETLRVYQGDVFIRPAADDEQDFQIARKPPTTLLAMRQLVHDTNHDPAELDAVDWPLRWKADGWQLEKSVEGKNVQQLYSIEQPADDAAWLRYQHVVPNYHVWQLVNHVSDADPRAREAALAELNRYQRPKLITDANPYNAREDTLRLGGRNSLEIAPDRRGLHWVGDLMLEANVEVQSSQGELLLDLVEGGRHFTCTINIATGEAVLSAQGDALYAPKATTKLNGPGNYRVAFANFDDHLLLWINDKLVSFDADTAYDVERIFGARREILPRTTKEDAGDLAPAGVGARDATLAVTRLRLWRDIYYIADSWENHPHGVGAGISEYDTPPDIASVLYDPARWDVFASRDPVTFPLRANQFFVMGDNSAESSDSRLWANPDPETGGKPGGAYLERRLLIGKALCVYWPHSWHRIPGTPIPFPLFPNIADMRLVR